MTHFKTSITALFTKDKNKSFGSLKLEKRCDDGFPQVYSRA